MRLSTFAIFLITFLLLLISTEAQNKKINKHGSDNDDLIHDRKSSKKQNQYENSNDIDAKKQTCKAKDCKKKTSDPDDADGSHEVTKYTKKLNTKKRIDDYDYDDKNRDNGRTFRKFNKNAAKGIQKSTKKVVEESNESEEDDEINIKLGKKYFDPTENYQKDQIKKKWSHKDEYTLEDNKFTKVKKHMPKNHNNDDDDSSEETNVDRKKDKNLNRRSRDNDVHNSKNNKEIKLNKNIDKLNRKKGIGNHYDEDSEENEENNKLFKKNNIKFKSANEIDNKKFKKKEKPDRAQIHNENIPKKYSKHKLDPEEDIYNDGDMKNKLNKRNDRGSQKNRMEIKEKALAKVSKYDNANDNQESVESTEISNVEANNDSDNQNNEDVANKENDVDENNDDEDEDDDKSTDSINNSKNLQNDQNIKSKQCKNNNCEDSKDDSDGENDDNEEDEDDEEDPRIYKKKHIKVSTKYAHEKRKTSNSMDDNILKKIHGVKKNNQLLGYDDDDDSSEEEDFPKRFRFIPEEEEY